MITVYRDLAEAACSVECVGGNDDHTAGTDVEICSTSSLHSLMFFETSASISTYYVAVSGFSSADFGSFELFLVTLSEDRLAIDSSAPLPTSSPAIATPQPTPGATEN